MKTVRLSLVLIVVLLFWSALCMIFNTCSITMECRWLILSLLPTPLGSHGRKCDLRCLFDSWCCWCWCCWLWIDWKICLNDSWWGNGCAVFCCSTSSDLDLFIGTLGKCFDYECVGCLLWRWKVMDKFWLISRNCSNKKVQVQKEQSFNNGWTVLWRQLNV